MCSEGTIFTSLHTNIHEAPFRHGYVFEGVYIIVPVSTSKYRLGPDHIIYLTMFGSGEIFDALLRPYTHERVNERDIRMAEVSMCHG